MKKHFMKFLMVLVSTVVLTVPALVGADVYMKEKHHTDGMTIMAQTQPPKDQIVTIWISKDQMRTDQGDTSSIMRLVNDKVLVINLNHLEKTFMELSFESEDLQDLGMKMTQKSTIKVTPTGETKKIGNWNCTKYIQEMDMGMMPMTSEIWATEDIKMPYYELYKKISARMTVQQPSMKAAMGSIEEENRKIKGVPVLTVTDMAMMQNIKVKSSRELLEIREDTAPGGIFEIPAGYAKQTMPGGMGERRMPGRQKQK
jgi:hypothetical protein